MKKAKRISIYDNINGSEQLSFSLVRAINNKLKSNFRDSTRNKIMNSVSKALVKKFIMEYKVKGLNDD